MIDLRFARRFRRAALALCALLVLASAAAAAPEVDSVLQGFAPDNDLIFIYQDAPLDDAEIFLAQRAGAYLVMSPTIGSPVLVERRTGQVSKVSLMKVVRRTDGRVDILADATPKPIGQIRIENQEVSFEIDGASVAFRQKPDLTGPQTRTSMLAYSPLYVERSTNYNPRPGDVGALEGEARNVRVEVYFGSWCNYCKRFVPRILKLDEMLSDQGNITFAYHGLPKQMDEDPVTKSKKIDGVPTGIVYVDDKPVGRLFGDQWRLPEKSLNDILTENR
ncbi:MAG: thioredoxin family protein [Acidobacteriota bacterium]